MAQSDRSVEIALFSWARHHMRAFHFAWGGFFIAFFAWFAISPLLSKIQVSLNITKAKGGTTTTLSTAKNVTRKDKNKSATTTAAKKNNSSCVCREHNDQNKKNRTA